MKTLIDFDGAVVVAIPVTSGFGESGPRECMLVEGPQGWGEFSPPRNIDDGQAARWLTAAVEPGTVGWPDPVRGRIPVAVTVPALGPTPAFELVAGSGCRTAEVHLSDSANDSSKNDIARLEAVRAALGPAGRIRCVADGAWDVDTAVARIAVLNRAADGLEYVEQPCATVDELAAVRRKVATRVGADVHRLPGNRADLTAAADFAVLTPSPLGGVRRSLRVAESVGVPCVVRSSRETSIGLAGAVALAGVLPDLPLACAVSRPRWVDADVTSESRALVARDGYVPVAPMPPAPERALLAAYAVTDGSVLARWRRRLEEARARV